MIGIVNIVIILINVNKMRGVKMQTKYDKQKRRILKGLAEILGCQNCGTHHNLGFHHRDPSTKLFGVLREISRPMPDLVNESLKCDVLCRTCHQRIHRIGWKRQFTYPHIGIGYRGKRYDLWYVRYTRDKKLSKYFKTKPEAIRFANQYALENI